MMLGGAAATARVPDLTAVEGAAPFCGSAVARAAGARAMSAERTERLADLFARVMIGSLFLALAISILRNFLETHRPTGLLLLLSELLVVILTIVRRRAAIVDRTWSARVIATVSLLGPPLLRPAIGADLVPEIVTAPFSACGLMIVIAGKLALGRSFGLMPANRGIVCAGPYRWVRHPIYLGYLITHFAFVVAHATWWNITAFLIADAALMARAVYEECTLRTDPAYVSYEQRVRWRVVPGAF
ncbi:MAG: DUF1295 domain-containing protein [Acidobacteria bacterium]|nr:DUF1295 domain-containing protein [Acidobacteriota bacterium]